jgi:hypothetical protein
MIRSPALGYALLDDEQRATVNRARAARQARRAERRARRTAAEGRATPCLP